MRNFKNEIEELINEIKDLNVTKEEKETQLKIVREEQRESIKNNNNTTFVKGVLRDRFGKPISIGDRVKTTTKGKHRSDHGRVIRYEKWVTFEDVTGVEQVRAPSNLIVQEIETTTLEKRKKIIA